MFAAHSEAKEGTHRSVAVGAYKKTGDVDHRRAVYRDRDIWPICHIFLA
jgi:hypothetical protein